MSDANSILGTFHEACSKDTVYKLYIYVHCYIVTNTSKFFLLLTTAKQQLRFRQPKNLR